MKHLIFPVVAIVLTMFSCNLQRPWSPEDDQGLDPSDLPSVGVDTIAPVKTDIGDAEQGIWLEGRLAAESADGRITSEEIKNRRDRLAIVNMTVPTPVPDALWIEYEAKVARNFEDTPVVLRVAVVIDDEFTAGEIKAVFGKDAQRTQQTFKVDLFSAFEQVPETFLAAIKGELILMPEGTDETTIDPATATSATSSMAVQGNPIRVTIVPGGTTEATPPAESASPADTEAASQDQPVADPAAPMPADAAPTEEVPETGASPDGLVENAPMDAPAAAPPAEEQATAPADESSPQQ